MKIAKETIETIMKQFTLDCNLKEAEEIASGTMYLSKSRALAGARIAADTSLFFIAILFMGKAYLMADESIYEGCKEVFQDVEPAWFCKFPNLRILDRILNEYDHEIADTHIYFLPDEDAKQIEETRTVEWYGRNEIAGMKDTNPFSNALCFSPTQPDIMAVAMRENDKLVAMAGASLDGAYVRQIGIDVNQAYQGKGMATYLTTLLKQRITEEGYLPFYGTSESHGISRSVAVRSGFLPAWTEIYVKKKTN